MSETLMIPSTWHKPWKGLEVRRTEYLFAILAKCGSHSSGSAMRLVNYLADNALHILNMPQNLRMIDAAEATLDQGDEKYQTQIIFVWCQRKALRDHRLILNADL